MVVTSGTVEGGKVVIGDAELAEGTMVTVMAPGDDEPFELSPAEEAAIRLGIEDVRAGRVITAAQLLERLARR